MIIILLIFGYNSYPPTVLLGSALLLMYPETLLWDYKTAWGNTNIKQIYLQLFSSSTYFSSNLTYVYMNIKFWYLYTFRTIILSQLHLCNDFLAQYITEDLSRIYHHNNCYYRIDVEYVTYFKPLFLIVKILFQHLNKQCYGAKF